MRTPEGRRPLVAALLAWLLLTVPALSDATLATFTIGNEEYSCFPQVSPLGLVSLPPVLQEGLKGVKIVKLSSPSCANNDDSAKSSAADILDSSDLSQVSGKVAVYELCSEATSRDEYWLDYFFKGLALSEAGAVMLVAVEAYLAKIPEHMDTELSKTLVTPACVMEKRYFAGLSNQVNGGEEFGSFAGLPFYVKRDEPSYDTPITSLQVVHTGDGTGSSVDVEFPTTTSTFNPSELEAMDGEVIHLQLKPVCYKQQSSDWASCVECWSSDQIGNGGGPVENFEAIVSASLVGKPKILFVPLQGDGITQGHNATCYSYFYHWAVIGQQLLAEAVVIGGANDATLTIPGPYLVGSKTVPAFALINLHSLVISQLLTETADVPNEVVQIKLPALTDQQGPPFYAPAEEELGLTAIGFWDDSIPSDDDDRHFECLAGQAIYNPLSYNGVAAPQFDLNNDILGGTGRSLEYVKPSTVCASKDTCAKCLKDSSDKLDLQAGVSYSDLVVLLVESDFPCFHKHSEFSKAAMEASPYALVVGQTGSTRHTISDNEGVFANPLSFPTYTITSECGDRVVGLCEADSSGCPEATYVQLPPIVNGVAQEYTTTSYALPLEEAFIKFFNPPELEADGLLPVGQANFNPQDHGHIDAEVVVGVTNDLCNSEDTCLECDKLPWRFKQPRAAFEGNVVFFSQIVIDPKMVGVDENGESTTFFFPMALPPQGVCLLPWSNIVMDLQEAGALGVLFMDSVNTARTLIQDGVPDTIAIPSFNVPSSLGLKILIYEFLSESQDISEADKAMAMVQVRLPRVSGGVASEDSMYLDVKDTTGDAIVVPASDYVGSSLLIPVWAITLACIGGLLCLCGTVAMVHLIRRKKKMFAYNQMDSAIQTEVLTDLMAGAGGAGIGIGVGPDDGAEGGFTDEPLYGHQESSGLQMVDMGGKHASAGTSP